MTYTIAHKLLTYLKGLSEEIVILGHDNTDCDSAISMILMSSWLTANEVRNKPIICDKTINTETYNILKEVGIDLNKYKGNVKPTDAVLLLDHYKTTHSTNVIACLDHHPTMEQVCYPFYLNTKISSTSLLVFKAMFHTGYNISSEQANLIIMATFIDTCSRLSSKYVQADESVITYLVHKFNLDFQKLIEIGLCLTDLGMSVEDICTNGRKNYVYTNIGVSSSYIQVRYFTHFFQNQLQYFNYIQSELLDNKTKLWIFLVSNLDTNIQIEYRITKSDVQSIEHKSILSRGTDIMPIIERDILQLVAH